jgi:hypothetical protein
VDEHNDLVEGLQIWNAQKNTGELLVEASWERTMAVHGHEIGRAQLEEEVVNWDVLIWEGRLGSITASSSR